MTPSKLLKILLVEDSESDTALLKENIRLSNIDDLHLDFACSLQEAIDHLQSNHVDAMLLDLTLPDSSGLETVRRIGQHGPDIPIVVLTGLKDENMGVEAVRLGAQDYLVKGSVDGRLIVRAIRYAIERKLAESKLRDAQLAALEMMEDSIAQRQKSEQLNKELKKLNRTLKALSNSNQAMMRAESEEQYLKEVCEIVVEDCGHKMVWIGFAEEDGKKSVRPVAWAGFEKGYMEKLKITWTDTERGKGPTGTAIRTSKPYICRNILTDPYFEPWRTEATKRGYASSGVFPLIRNDKAFGAINIYSTNPDPFSKDEIQLLAELANDLSYGITAIRTRIAKEAAQKELKKERDFSTAVLDTAGALVVVLDRRGRIMRFNRACESLSGYSAPEVLGRSFWEFFILPEELPNVKKIWKKLWAGDFPNKYENHWLTKNGTRRLISWSNTAITNQKGRVENIIGTGMDITERKQADEALRESEERHRLLAETMLQGVVHQSADGTIIAMNPAAERILGKTRAEFLGGSSVKEEHHTVREDGSPFPGMEHPAMVALRSGQPVHDVVMGLFNPRRNERRWISIDAVPIFRPGDTQPVEVYTVFEDITERRAAQEALRELNTTLERKVAERTEELEHRARQLQKLTLELTEAEERERKRVAEILHDDLQQVLVAATFYVELLNKRVRKDAESRKAAEQVQDLLVDAIDKSRSLSHELSSPALYQGDLGRAFRWLARHMQKRHGFTVHLQIGGRIEVDSEPRRLLLYHAAQELLLNVIKHAGVREATLRLRRQDDRIRLTVSDRGQGFDPADTAHVLGLGLLSIRERVEGLGGSLKIKSTPDKGSTFTISVPDVESTPQATTKPLE